MSEDFEDPEDPYANALKRMKMKRKEPYHKANLGTSPLQQLKADLWTLQNYIKYAVSKMELTEDEKTLLINTTTQACAWNKHANGTSLWDDKEEDIVKNLPHYLPTAMDHYLKILREYSLSSSSLQKEEQKCWDTTSTVLVNVRISELTTAVLEKLMSFRRKFPNGFEHFFLYPPHRNLETKKPDGNGYVIQVREYPLGTPNGRWQEWKNRVNNLGDFNATFSRTINFRIFSKRKDEEKNIEYTIRQYPDDHCEEWIHTESGFEKLRTFKPGEIDTTRNPLSYTDDIISHITQHKNMSETFPLNQYFVSYAHSLVK